MKSKSLMYWAILMVESITKPILRQTRTSLIVLFTKMHAITTQIAIIVRFRTACGQIKESVRNIKISNVRFQLNGKVHLLTISSKVLNNVETQNNYVLLQIWSYQETAILLNILEISL